MTVKLDLLELVALQEISKGRKPKGINISELESLGLVHADSLTPLGVNVLERHLPFGTTRDFSLENSQIRKIAFNLKIRTWL